MSHHGLSKKKSYGPICPCGSKKSSVFFRLCWSCQKHENFSDKERARFKRKSERALKRNEAALKGMTKLPAKNRKKSKIIDALMAGLPPSRLSPSPKPKTIRYESIETKLLLKKLEEF